MSNDFKRFYYKTNHLGKLQVFIKVYELGTAIKASKVLNTSQPAISMQIKSLEDALELPLFERVGAKLAPTEHGHLFYKAIIGNVAGIEDTLKNFKSLQDIKASREVRIAAHHIFITRIMGKYLAKISPDIKIHIFDYSRDQAIEQLRTGGLDIAIYPMYEHSDDIESYELMSCKPLLAMHKDNALQNINMITPSDIATQNVLRIRKELIILAHFNAIYKEYKWHSNIKFDSADWGVLMALVKNNLGVAVVSEICIDDDKDIIFKDLSHIFPNMVYTIAVKKSLFVSESVEYVLDIFKSGL